MYSLQKMKINFGIEKIYQCSAWDEKIKGWGENQPYEYSHGLERKFGAQKISVATFLHTPTYIWTPFLSLNENFCLSVF